MNLPIRFFVVAILISVAGTLTAQSQINGQWDERFYLSPGCDGQVSDIARTGTGVIYIGGSFTFCDGVRVNNIARYIPASNSFEPLQEGEIIGTDGPVNALAWLNGQLIAGGTFTMAGETSANSLARWNGGGWSRLGTATINGVNASVNALHVQSDTLLVGGSFTEAGGLSANRIARWSAGSWTTLGDGFNDSVNAIVSIGALVIAGGDFDESGAESMPLIAQWDGGQWTPVGSGAQHGPGFSTNDSIKALDSDGTDLYVGGNFLFFTDGPETYSGVMRWDGSSWDGLGNDFDGGNNFPQVQALVVDSGQIFAGGGINSIGGTLVNNIARWDGSNWIAVGQGPAAGTTGSSITVYALSPGPGGLLLGGSFHAVDGQVSHGFARLSGSALQPLGQPGGLGFAGEVLDVIRYQGDLIATGLFNTAGDIVESGIVRFDGQQWQPLGAGLSGYGWSMTEFQGWLYVGGGFSEAGGQPAANLARWNGTEWQSVGTGSEPAGGFIKSLVSDTHRLYAAGNFTGIDGVAATNIASFDGTQWQALETFQGEGIDGQIVTMAIVGGDLVVGGSFSEAGGLAATNIASWDDVGWAPVGSGLNGTVAGLTRMGNQAIASGIFTEDGDGNQVRRLARLEAGQWQEFGGFESTGWGAGTLSRGANLLFVAGDFPAPQPASSIAAWDGSQWLTLGPPEGNGLELFPPFVPARINAIIPEPDLIVVGGLFFRTGSGIPTHGLAIFHTSAPGDTIFGDRFQLSSP